MWFRWIYLILLSALALRIYYILSNSFPPPVGDAMFYDEMAKQFLETGILGYRQTEPNAIVMPGLPLPREILPLSVIGSNLINYFLTLVILIPALWISGVHLTTALFSFPVVLFIQTLLIFSIVMLVSLGVPYLRDLEHILNVLMIIFFYLTPVLFPSFIPEPFRWIFDYNPMTPIINAYRDLFLYGQWPDFGTLLPMLLVLIVLNTAIAVVFSVLQRKVVEEV